MAWSYEVAVDSAAGILFLSRLAQSLKAEGFQEVASLRRDTSGLKVLQFRRGTHALTLAISPERGGKEKIALSSETLGLESQIVAAVTEAAAEFLSTFLSPLTLYSRLEVEEAICQRLRELVDSQIRGAIP